ncbi:DUF721 domain-containing protein [Robertkochia sediminum]|uniref:DUF721 domain-containing protein n=1 Tax=Robertkochia sediminum TaxID=2785326 RepID=UPI0019321A1B|nr:DUF721 domain-containing protein [Robertkochia sediminum]MBL7472155.1 DUF721 domain-containing protein [Robertkochia sediminum]
MAKRNNEYRSLSDALKDFINENKLEKGLEKIDARDAWINLMGNGINNYTTDIQLKGDTLYVSLSSSVLREELSYGKEKIKTMLNEELGREVIQKIILR